MIVKVRVVPFASPSKGGLKLCYGCHRYIRCGEIYAHLQWNGGGLDVAPNGAIIAQEKAFCYDCPNLDEAIKDGKLRGRIRRMLRRAGERPKIISRQIRQRERRTVALHHVLAGV